METPPNFRQMNYRNRKKGIANSQKIELEQLAAKHEEEVSEFLLKLLDARDTISKLEKELEQSNRDRDKYASMAGIKPKSRNAVYQARYRQRLKEKALDNKDNA